MYAVVCGGHEDQGKLCLLSMVLYLDTKRLLWFVLSHIASSCFLQICIIPDCLYRTILPVRVGYAFPLQPLSNLSGILHPKPFLVWTAHGFEELAVGIDMGLAVAM